MSQDYREVVIAVNVRRVGKGDGKGKGDKNTKTVAVGAWQDETVEDTRKVRGEKSGIDSRALGSNQPQRAEE